MTEDSKSSTSWRTILVSVVLSLIAAFITTDYTIKQQSNDTRKKAEKYADSREKQLKINMERRWSDYRADSVQWQIDRKGEIDRAVAGLSRGAGVDLGAVAMAKDTINRKYEKLIEEGRKGILRDEEDERLRIQTIREVGVLLQ